MQTSQKGITLIEVIIYIALFTLLMGGSLLTVYQLITANAQTNVKSVVQNEESFTMRKIEWALSSINPNLSYVPSSGSSSYLSLTRYDGTRVYINRSGTKVQISEDGGITFYPLTTDNVQVTALTFTYIAPTGTGPAGITASMAVRDVNDPQTFTVSTSKYIRK